MRLLSRRLLPIVFLVRCFSVQDAGSYTWPERVLLLDSVTTVVPIGNSRSASLRGGVQIVVLVRCFSVQDAGSYTWPERVLLLDSVTTVVPIENSRNTSSRGGVVSVFRERF